MLLISIVISVYTVSKISNLEERLPAVETEVPEESNEKVNTEPENQKYDSAYSENDYENFEEVITEINEDPNQKQ